MRIERTHAVALLATASMTGWTIVYAYQMKFGQTEPNLVTWVLVAVAVTIGLWTYITAEQEEKPDMATRLITNTTNVVDFIAVWAVLASILLLSKHVRFEPSPFEAGCLAAAALIFVYYLVGRHPWSANLAVNLLLTVAYFPTVRGLLQTDHNIESVAAWSFGLVASLSGLYNSTGTLARVYAWRAVLSVSAVLIIMLARFPPWQ